MKYYTLDQCARRAGRYPFRVRSHKYVGGSMPAAKGYYEISAPISGGGYAISELVGGGVFNQARAEEPVWRVVPMRVRNILVVKSTLMWIEGSNKLKG